jgi:DNA-binding SARP family transcriptional activator
LRLDLLGAPRVHGQDDADVLYLDRKTAALLAYLAIVGPVSRSRAAGLLWPDTSESRARNNLRQLLHRLRAAAPIVHGDDPLSLAPDVDTDVTRILGGSANGSGYPIGGVVAELLAGVDYADCDELNEWLLVERERIRQAQRVALESEADRFEREGDFNPALATAHLLLEMEPVSEAAHRRIMRLHYLNNDRPAALEAYHRCQAILRQVFHGALWRHHRE